MSLAKQLILLISFIFIAIFSINFYSSINNVRHYLQIEAELHAQDTATSLGLSLSPYILEEENPILETMINAIFDRGYYLSIVLKNRKDKELIQKVNPVTFEEVPPWFVKLLPMETVTAKSDIDAGWVKGGTIYVTIHPGFGYLKLWEQCKQTFIYSVIMLVICIVLLIVILSFVLNPLKKIDRLARSIADGNFGTIEKLPWTKEIRNIAVSMNFMSGKIENAISSLNSRLEEASKQLRLDELTGLETKGSFETEMKQRFMEGGTGFVFLLRIDNLGKLAQALSSDKVDEFILRFVDTTKEILAESGMSRDCLFRILGAEFIVVADGLKKEEAENFCTSLLDKFKLLGEPYQKQNVAHIGGAVFNPHVTTNSVVSKATEALEKARLISANAYSISEETGTTYDKDQWKTLVRDIIDSNLMDVKFNAKAYDLREDRDGQLLIEEAQAKVFGPDGEFLPIGTFISVAENTGRIIAFDLGIIQQVIDYIRKDQVQHDVAVNLSFSSLADNDFRAQLYELLSKNKDISQNLVFCVTAYAATRDLKSFASFIEFVHRNGAKIILKRFESRFIPMDDIKEFKLDYIRLAMVYTEKISRNREKQQIVKAMQELGSLLDIAIIAEGVGDDADLLTLKELGVTAVSR